MIWGEHATETQTLDAEVRNNSTNHCATMSPDISLPYTKLQMEWLTFVIFFLNVPGEPEIPKLYTLWWSDQYIPCSNVSVQIRVLHRLPISAEGYTAPRTAEENIEKQQEVTKVKGQPSDW